MVLLPIPRQIFRWDRSWKSWTTAENAQLWTWRWRWRGTVRGGWIWRGGGEEQLQERIFSASESTIGVMYVLSWSFFRLIQWIHSLVNTLIIGCYKKKENLTWRAPKWSLWTKGLLGSIDSVLPSSRGADNSPCGEVILVQPPSLHLV